MTAADPVNRTAILGEFVRFGCVGTLGFVVDSTVLYAGLWAGLGLYLGRLVSYLASATFSWAVNRRFTFRSQLPPSVSEWLRFLAANSVGGMTNLAIYAALVARFAMIAAHPVIAVGIGAIAGMFINFTLSRQAVFRPN